MLADATRPLIFVDIDGVLIPFRARSAGTLGSSGGVTDAADGFGNPLLDNARFYTEGAATDRSLARFCG